MTVDELSVIITANNERFTKTLQDTTNQIQKATKSIGNNVSSGMDGATKNVSSGIINILGIVKKGIIALGIGKLLKDSISTAMDSIESDNLFDVSMGKFAKDTYEWSEKISNALGLSAVAIRKNTGVIFNMTSAMGIAQKHALSMAKGVSVLAEDMASFYNIDPSSAFDKIQSGLTGMGQGLKALGILIDDDTIKQVAYSNGIAKQGTELTNQQKVLARYIAILKQTKNAQGDLARTLESPTNLIRRLKTEISNCANTIGTILMPIVSKALVYINAFVKVLSNALSSLASFLGFGKSNLDNSTASAKDNIGILADNMSDANKSAKSMKKNLASFDEITNLGTPEVENNTNVDASGIPIGFDLGEYNAGLDAIEDKTKEVVDKIQKIFDSFKIKKIDFTPITESLKELLKALKPFGQDIWEGLKWGIENVLSPLANFVIETALPAYLDLIANAYKRLHEVLVPFKDIVYEVKEQMLQWAGETGVPILLDSVAGAVSGVDSVIQNLEENISNIDVFAILENVSDCAINIFKTVSETVIAVEDALSKLWDDIKDNLENFLINCFELVKAMFVDVKDEIKNKSKEIKKSINNLISDIWNTLLAPVIKKLTQFLSDISDKLLDFWNNHGKPIVEAIGEAIDNTIKAFQNFWDNVVKPIIEPWFAMITDFWDNHGKPMLDKLLNCIGKLIEGILELYNEAFLPFVNWIIDKAKPILQWLAEIIFEYLGNKINTVVDVAGDLLDVLSGIIDFVVGVFTGNWDKAWDGIVGTVKGVKNMISDIIKGMVNFIISGVNILISGLNKISFEVPDWVPGIGGKTLGFNIPKIPKLARGGIVNSPTVAMIGESGREAVVPLENNTEWIDKLANRLLTIIAAIKQNEDNRPINVTVTSKLNGKVVSKELIRDLNSEAKRLGYREILST